MSMLWRLTRTETARRVYDALKVHGLAAAQMDEYVADATAVDTNRNPPSGVETRALDPTEACRFEGRYDAFSELRNNETVVCAFDAENRGRDSEGGEDGEVVDSDLVGYFSLGNPGLTYRAHPPGADMTSPGGYVRRVFAAPEARNRSVTTTLVSRAVATVGKRGTKTVHALVAYDNRSS